MRADGRLHADSAASARARRRAACDSGAASDSAATNVLVHVRIVSLRRGGGVGGPPTEIINMVNQSVTLNGGLGSRSTAIAHDRNDVPPDADAGPIPGPDYDTYASLCTTHEMTLWSLTLTYTSGVPIGP